MATLYLMSRPGWTLPIWVDNYDDVAAVSPAGNMLPHMRDALMARLAEIGWSNGKRWFVTRETLVWCARPVFDELRTPDLYIRWDPRPPLEQQAPEMDDFLQDLVWAGFAPSIVKARALFSGVIQAMFHRLAIQRKSLPLGFITLEPMPLRPNWCDMLSTRIENYRRSLRNRGQPYHWPELIWALPKWLADGHLLMYSKRDTYQLWDVLVRHHRDWYRANIRMERRRKLEKSSWPYHTETVLWLIENEPKVRALYLEHISKAAHPHVKFRGGLVTRSRQQYEKPKVEKVERALARARDKRHRKVDIRTGKKKRSFTVGPKIKGVRKVSRLRQGAQDLRRPPDVDQPADAAAGT